MFRPPTRFEWPGRDARTEELLWQLAADIEPTRQEKHAAARSQRYLREVLNTGHFGRRVQGVHLSGSYARDTAITPLEDVDIIVLVDPAEWSKGLLARYPEADTILQSFATALRRRYPESSVFLQRRSIRLELYHIHIDLVPAIADESTPNHILIPDRSASGWIKSGPRIHTREASALNARCGGLFKPLVKIAKFWNLNLPSTTRLKSFQVETMAVRYFRRRKISSLTNGLLSFWDAISSFGGHALTKHVDIGFSFDAWLGPELQDVAQTGVNLLKGLEDKRRRRLIERARVSRDHLLTSARARSEESGLSKFRTAFRC